MAGEMPAVPGVLTVPTIFNRLPAQSSCRQVFVCAPGNHEILYTLGETHTPSIICPQSGHLPSRNRFARTVKPDR